MDVRRCGYDWLESQSSKVESRLDQNEKEMKTVKNWEEKTTAKVKTKARRPRGEIKNKGEDERPRASVFSQSRMGDLLLVQALVKGEIPMLPV
jgi:hypothetical protein